MLCLSKLRQRAAHSLGIRSSLPACWDALSWAALSRPPINLPHPPSALMHTRLNPQLGSSPSPRPTWSMRHTTPLQPHLLSCPPTASGLLLPRLTNTLVTGGKPWTAAISAAARPPTPGPPATGPSATRRMSSNSRMDDDEQKSDVRLRVEAYKTARETGQPLVLPKARKATPISVPLDAQEYWLQVLDKIKKSNVEDMKNLMDVTHPVGITLELAKQKGSMIACYDLHLKWKMAFPKNIILMQIGDFYETVGLDALVMIQWLGYRPSAADKGIPKAGAPKNQLGKVVADLNGYGFTVSVIGEVNPSQSSLAATTRTKDRVLIGVSSPAQPLYLPPSGSGEGDNSNQLFAQPKPMIGIGWSKTGFTTLVLTPELRTIEIRQAMTWEAVMALLGAKGAAAMLLHTSLKSMHKDACRLALTRIARNEVANFTTFGGDGGGCDDMTELFVAEVQAQLCQDPGGTADKIKSAPFKLVYNHDREEGRPQPLPRSTVMQLGLEGDLGIRSVQEVVLPDGSVLCQGWMKQLLLLPPPPHMALHIQGMVKHLRNTDEVLSNLNTELPGSKVTEVLVSMKGDAPFFRELHGMLGAVIDMLGNEGHAELWRHALPYTTWSDKRPTEGLTAAELLKRLQQAVSRIEDVVELQPRSAASRAGDVSSDTEQDEVAAAAPRRKARKQQVSEEEVQSFWDSHERFRFSVVCHQIEGSTKQVDIARSALLESLTRFKDALVQRSPSNSPSSKPFIKNLEDDHLAVQVPSTALLTSEVVKQVAEKSVKSLASPLEYRGGRGAWVTGDISAKREAYDKACDVAQQEADALLCKLCEDLVPLLPDLLQACHCSVVITALQKHTQAAMKAGWTVPQLVPFQMAADGSRSDLSGDVSQAPSMCMSLEGYWPYWMSREGSTVLNNIILDRLLLLTGPNMAGKSTVLRAMCAAALLANCGLMVPALRAHVPFYDAFVLRNFSGDSPVENMSSFAMEMQEVSIADQQCTSRSLVLLDEMCKGTEVAKGTALAAAVIIGWCTRGFTGIFASHFHTLVSITQDQGLERNGTLAYKRMGLTDGDAMGRHRKGTWKLEDGHCFESLAFEVAQQQGMREELITSAERIYDAMLAGAYPMSGRPMGAVQAAVTSPARAATPPTEASLPASVDTTLDTTTSRTLDTYTPPDHTLDEALDVMRAVVGQRFEGEERSAEDQPMFKLLKPGQTPPPSHAGRAALYVVQWANGAFYSGETGCISKRVKEHRGSPGKGPATRHRGPETSMVYCLMPDGEAHAARELEPKVISALKDKAFPLTSSKDQKKTRIARNSKSEVDKV